MSLVDHPFIGSFNINNEEIFFELVVSLKARSMRLQIIDGRLQLVLPRGVALYSAESFVADKIGWIKKHLADTNHKPGNFLFLGNELKMRQEFELFVKHHKINCTGGELKIVSPSGSKADVKNIYSAWLRQQAKEYIATRAYKLARENNFVVNKISIRGQKTRWGSCSSRCNLSFNFRLMQYRKEVIDYVIFHELCHLVEMNHSENFWSLLKKILPGL